MKTKLTPEQLEKRKDTNKKILKFGCLPILLLIVVITILANLSGGSKHNKDNNTNAVFNVPDLIELNIDSIRKVLGAPNTSVEKIEPSKKEIATGIKSWTNYFDKGVYELEARFNPISRNLINFWMSERDTSMHDHDYESLLSICNLDDDNSKYSVEKSILNSGQLAGIIIIKKIADHSSAAYVEARELAKKSLKYPDEADFDWTPTYDQNEGENNYRIVGKVITKNGFGVKQKLTFKCVLHYKGGDDMETSSWDVVEDISFDE